MTLLHRIRLAWRQMVAGLAGQNLYAAVERELALSVEAERKMVRAQAELRALQLRIERERSNQP